MKREIKFAVDDQLFALRKKNNKKYKYSDVARFSGLERKGLENLANNKTYQDLLSTLSGILDFFSAEGMPITIDQLFTVQEEGSQAENLDSQPL